MERYDPKTDLEDHEKFVGMVKSEDGGWVLYADAQRALDAERADNAMAREAYWATIADLRSELATLQAQLRQVEGERAKWEDIAGLRFAGDHKFVKEMELLKVENTTLRQLVEAILLADERGQGLPFKEAMDAAAKAINWNSLPPPTEERHE